MVLSANNISYVNVFDHNFLISFVDNPNKQMLSMSLTLDLDYATYGSNSAFLMRFVSASIQRVTISCLSLSAIVNPMYLYQGTVSWFPMIKI